MSDGLSVDGGTRVGHNRDFENGTNPQVRQLFARLAQEIEEKNPSNIIFFIVDFLCKHYPRNLAGFASIWNGDPDLERDRLQVVEFFRFQKLPTEIASQFTNAGFDTLETLCTITPEALDDIERFNQARWLPGHRVRLQQTFTDVCTRVRAYRQEREKQLHIQRLTRGHCDHPSIMTRTDVRHPPYPATSIGPNPLPQIRSMTPSPLVQTVTPPPMVGVPMSSSMPHPFIISSMGS